MSSCIQEAFLLKDLSSSLSLYLSFCVSLSSSWSPPDEPWCSPRSDDVWYVSGSAQIAEMWLFIDDRLTDWRRRRRRKATVRSAPDGSDKYTACWVFLALRHMLYLCICTFDTWEYHFWYPWTILFSKIYHILGLSGTSSYAVFVYLCICIYVFAHLTHGSIIFDTL